MPETVTDDDILSALFGPLDPPPSSAEPSDSDILEALSAPDTVPYTPITTAGTDTVAGNVRTQTPRPLAADILEGVTTRLERFRGNQYHIAHNRVFYALSELGFKNIYADFAGRAGVDLENAVNDRMARLYRDRPEVRSADVSEQSRLRTATLIDETLGRASGSREEFVEAATTTGRTMVARALAAAFPGGAPGATTPEGVARQNEVAASAQRLQALTPEQWADYALFASRHTGERPRNDTEEALFSSRARFAAVPPGTPLTTDVQTEVGYHLRVLTQNPQAPDNYVAMRRQVQRATNLKKAGVLNGDPFKEGILVADPEADLGYSPLQFLANSTLAEVARPVAAATGKAPTEAEVSREALATGASLEETRARLNARILVEAGQAVELALRPEREGSVLPDLTPEAAASIEGTVAAPWRGSGIAYRHIVSFLDDVVGLGRQASDAVRDAQRDTVWQELGRVLVNNFTRNNELASQQRDFFSALTTVGKWALFATIIRSDFAEQAKLGGGADAGAQGAYLREALDVGKMWEHGRAAAYQEQEERLRRIGTAIASGDPRNTPLLDVGRAAVFGMVDGLAQGFVGILDRPESIPLVLAGEKLGDAMLLGARQAVRGLVSRAAHAASLKVRLAELGALRPKAVDDILAYVNNAIERHVQAGTYDQVAPVLNEAQARAKVLRDAYVEHKAVRADKRDVEAFATAVTRAMPHIEDDLGGLGEELMANVAPPPSTFEWKQVADLWKAWRGKVPQTVTRDINRFLARTSRVDLAEMAARLSNPTTQFDPIVELTAKLDATADPEARAAIAAKLIDLKGSVNHEGGMVGVLRDLYEMGAKAASADPDTQARVRELGGRLSDHARLTEIDTATLRVLGELVDNRATHPVWDTLARAIHRVTGGRAFSSGAEIGQFNSAVKVLEAFHTQHAQNLYTAKLTNGLRAMRLERVYDYAIAKVEGQISAATVAGDDASVLRDALVQLRTERRSALTRPVEEAWSFDQTKLARRLVRPDEFVKLVKDDPLLFGVADTDAVLGQGPTHEQGVEVGLADDMVKLASDTLAAVKELRKQTDGYARLPAWLTRSLAAKTAPGRLVTMLDDRLKMLKKRGESLRHARSSLARGEKATPETQAAFVQAMKDSVDRAVEGGLNPDLGTIYKAFLDAIPAHYWSSEVRLRLLGRKEAGFYGDYSSFARLLRVFDHSDPTVFFHEFGHHFMHAVLEDSELIELRKIFEKDYAPLETAVPSFDNYMNQFTEWFARRFAQYAQEKVLPTTAAAGVFERAWQRFRGMISKIRQAFMTAKIEPPAEAWMARFFAGEVKTVQSPLGPGQAYSRDQWHNLRGVPGTKPEGALSPEATVGMSDQDLSTLYTALVEEDTALTKARPLLEKAAAGDAIDPALKAVEMDWGNAEAAMAARVRKAQERLESARTQLALPEELAERMMDVLGSPGVRDELRAGLASLERVRSAATGHSFLNPNFDLATVAAMPFWDQARVLREFRRTTAQRITIHAQRLADLSAALNRMEDADRRALTSALTRGVPVDDALLAKYPTIRRLLPHRGTAADARAANLNAWLKSEGEAQAALIEAAHRAGFIDDATLNGMERQGYRPHLYGMYERPKLVTSRTFREAKRAIKGGQGAGIEVGKDGTELMFARDLAKWRVRSREADGFVHDELFDTAKAARAYVRRKFGSETAAGLKREGEAYDVGRTAFGDEVVIADPIGDVGADTLDLLTGNVVKVFKKNKKGEDVWTGRYKARERASPIGRLESFAKLNRDLHIHAMLETLQEFGMVLRPEEFHSTLAARRGGTADFSAQYVQLPNSAQSFGNLRGAFVHRRVLSELNSLNHSYDQLRTWVEALGDVYIRHGLTPPTEVLGEAPGRLSSLDRAWGLTVKTTQIVMNSAAVFSNVTSNLLFGLLAGGPDVFSFRNLDGWATAISDVMGEVPREFVDALPVVGRSKRLPSARYQGKSAAWDSAVKHGVIDGALFDRIDNRDLRDGLLRVTGLVGPEAPALKKRLAKLQGLLDEKAAAVRDGRSASGIAQVELEIAAIEEDLRHNDRGMLRRMADWSAGLIGATYRNSLGVPTNAMTAFLRDFYGRLDDVFKYATFLHLRKSMPDEMAAWHVKTFMQNYANVPTAITQLGRSPLGALVPSFGYEMGRIFVSGLRHKPLRAMGLMGSIYALNAVSAVAAGVPFDRVDEMQKSAGYKDWFSRFVNTANTLNVYDPRTKDLVASYGLGNSFIPIYSFLDSQGAVANLTDEVIPDESRTGLMAPVAAAMQGAGNFIGGRPYLNALAGIAFNRDPATGRPLVSEDPQKVSWWDRARAAWHVVGKGLIPPLAPGGRQFAQIWDSYDTPVHPDTGKPVAGSTPAQAVVRSLTNINLKGQASYRVAQLLDSLGAGSGRPEPGAVANDATILKSLMWEVRGVSNRGEPDTPLFGDDATERRLWAAWKNEQDPARKKDAEAALRAQLAKAREIYVRGRRVTVGRDEHEMFLAMKAMQERGSDTQFARLTPEQQALVITGMDAVGHAATVTELVRLAKFNADRTRVNLESNPYAVQAAQRVVIDWVKEGRARQPVLDYLNYLQRIERRAFGASRRQQARERARERAAQ